MMTAKEILSKARALLEHKHAGPELASKGMFAYSLDGKSVNSSSAEAAFYSGAGAILCVTAHLAGPQVRLDRSVYLDKVTETHRLLARVHDTLRGPIEELRAERPDWPEKTRSLHDLDRVADKEDILWVFDRAIERAK